MLGLVFFAIGILQTLSFVAATALAERFGLLSTMVFTHLPSNLLLAAIGFAPNLAVGLTLLVARSSLSSMDVPPRQAVLAGGIKAGYDLALWRWFRTVELPDDAVDTALGRTGSGPAGARMPGPAQASEPQ